MSADILIPSLWTPQSRFGAWWRRAREWRASIATYLKVGPSGHLLFGPTGRLVDACGPPPPPAACYDCKNPAPSAIILTVSGATVCSSNTVGYGDPNGTYTLAYDPSIYGAARCPYMGTWTYTNQNGGSNTKGQIAFLLDGGRKLEFYTNAPDNDQNFATGIFMGSCSGTTWNGTQVDSATLVGPTTNCATFGGSMPFYGASATITVPP